jgi:hypothetical protein
MRLSPPPRSADLNVLALLNCSKGALTNKPCSRRGEPARWKRTRSLPCVTIFVNTATSEQRGFRPTGDRSIPQQAHDAPMPRRRRQQVAICILPVHVPCAARRLPAHHISRHPRARRSSQRPGSMPGYPIDALASRGTHREAGTDAGSAGSGSLRYRSESEFTQRDRR